MKYKAGDKVRVRDDLVLTKYYGKCSFVGTMEGQRGKIVTIVKIGGGIDDAYSIKETGYYWTDEMFEGLAEPEEPKRKFKVGDSVRVVKCDEERRNFKQEMHDLVKARTVLQVKEQPYENECFLVGVTSIVGFNEIELVEEEYDRDNDPIYTGKGL